MTFDELYRKALDSFPEAEIGEDNDGQLVIYTNLAVDPMGDGQKLMSFSELMESSFEED